MGISSEKKKEMEEKALQLLLQQQKLSRGLASMKRAESLKSVSEQSGESGSLCPEAVSGKSSSLADDD